MIFEFVKNNGYKWNMRNGIHFKGYFTMDSKDHELFREEKALDALSQIDTEEDFYDFLVHINGVFSIVIKKNDCVYAAVDIARSMPLYFSQDGQIVSDSAQRIKELLGNEVTIDENNFAFLYAVGYTIENSTAYAEIKQLDMGELCVIKNNEIKVRKYFYHLENTEILSDEIYTTKLSEVSEKVFERIKTAIDGRPVVLSMSGGYDSRFVGCMLKNAGVEDVLCYTYGKKDSFEVIQSKKNAQMLGFRWVCIEYSDKLVQDIIEGVGKEYLKINNNHDFCAYVQNFPAVKVLHENNYIKPNSVFITGLCGDMPTGCYIEERCENKEYDSYSAAEALYNLIFGRIKLKGKLKQEELERLHCMVKKLPIEVKDYQSWVTAVSAIHTGSCHSRQYLHMNDPHDFFGYEWLLPYWDKELLKIWYSIPASQKIGQKLYSQWLLNKICEPFGIGQPKTVVKHSSNVVLNKIKHLVGGSINYLLLNLHIPFRRSYDYNNFAPLEEKLFRKLKTRRWIKYSKANLTVILNQYIMQERYGTEPIKRINKYIS